VRIARTTCHRGFVPDCSCGMAGSLRDHARLREWPLDSAPEDDVMLSSSSLTSTTPRCFGLAGRGWRTSRTWWQRSVHPIRGSRFCAAPTWTGEFWSVPASVLFRVTNDAGFFPSVVLLAQELGWILYSMPAENHSRIFVEPVATGGLRSDWRAEKTALKVARSRPAEAELGRNDVG
jgi:hypothetical protein